MNGIRRAVLLTMLVVLTLPASAGQEWAQKAINKPAESWGFWGNAKIEIVNDAEVEGGTARRVTIFPKPKAVWDIGAYITITKAVKKGDAVLLAFWARAEQPPEGNDFALTSGRVYETAPPRTSITPETSFLIGRQWKLYYASGTADKDYPAGTLGCGMLLGSGEQIIDFGPAYIVDFGPDYDTSKLPQN